MDNSYCVWEKIKWMDGYWVDIVSSTTILLSGV